jgi:hypothetical protein
MLVERSEFFSMGVSIRTETYRYTEWTQWNGSSLSPRLGRKDVCDKLSLVYPSQISSSSVCSFDAAPIGVELYNHSLDDGMSFDGDFEVVNCADDPSYAGVRAQLAALLRDAYFENSVGVYDR